MADGTDWKYYKEKCKVLLIFSQEKCVFPYDYIIDDSALAPNSHHSRFPGRLLAGFARRSRCGCCPPVQGPGAVSPGAWGRTHPTTGAGGLSARLCVALQETRHLSTALQSKHLFLIDSDSRRHEEC